VVALTGILVLIGLVRLGHAYAFLLVEGGQGLPRRWETGRFAGRRIPWFVTDAPDGRLAGGRTLADVSAAAFGHWQDLSESAIAFSFRGSVRERSRDATDGRNLVTFGDARLLGTGVLGVTFVTSDSQGHISDADIVLSRGVEFSTSPGAVAGRFDVESVLTHEVGHLIGLDHSGLIRATMAPFTDRGDVHQRSLELDDAIAGGMLYPAGAFPAGRGALVGRVSLGESPVFLSHVVATKIHGRVVASGYTRPDGTYRIDGLPPNVYLVHAERLDGPVRPANLAAFREGFQRAETTDYETTFHLR